MDAKTRHLDESNAATMDVWFDSAVRCGSMRVGTVTGVVCTALAPRVHDVVVRDANAPHEEHLVDRRHVARSDNTDLSVDLTTAEIRARRVPGRTVMVTEDAAYWWDTSVDGAPDWSAYHEPLQVPVTVPDLAADEVLVHHHAVVYAGTHHVGRLAGLRMAADGAVADLIVDVGHRWHHRYVLVPRTSIAELTESVALVGGSPAQIRHMQTSLGQRSGQNLTAVEPQDLGVDDHDPDTPHIEAAHLIADGARERLRAQGFSDDEIRHWADAFVDDRRSGDVADFLDWIDAREHVRTSSPDIGRDPGMPPSDSPSP